MAERTQVSGVREPYGLQGYWPDCLRETYEMAPADVGHRIQDDRGRVFHLARAAEDAISQGDLVVGEPSETEIGTGNVADTSAGAREVDIDVNVDENEYKGGALSVVTGSGAGFKYLIKSHSAGDGSGDKATFVLEEDLQAAIANSDSQFRLTQHLLENTEQADTGDSAPPQGKAMADPDADEYYWVQTWGPALMKSDGTTSAFAQGDALAPGSNNAGTVEDEGDADLIGSVGSAIVANASTGEWAEVFLRCMP